VGRYIIKLKDYYLEWSTIVDAPLTYGMALDEFKGYYKDEYGNDGLRDLPNRLARVEAKGTSAHDEESAESTIWLNRAGPKERPSTIVGIYHHYCLDEEWRDEWFIPREILNRDDDHGEHYAAAVAGWPEP